LSAPLLTSYRYMRNNFQHIRLYPANPISCIPPYMLNATMNAAISMGKQRASCGRVLTSRLLAHSFHWPFILITHSPKLDAHLCYQVGMAPIENVVVHPLVLLSVVSPSALLTTILAFSFPTVTLSPPLAACPDKLAFSVRWTTTTASPRTRRSAWSGSCWGSGARVGSMC
jgi:hypothetical protein